MVVAHGWREIKDFAQSCYDLDFSHSVINPELVQSEGTTSLSSPLVCVENDETLPSPGATHGLPLSTLTRLLTLDPVRRMEQAAQNYINS